MKVCDTMSSKIAGYRSLADQKQYLKLIAANTVSRFGDSLDAIAFSWVMYQVTGSASLIALILAFNFLPTILLQPFAGVLADRIPKRKVMVLCDFGRAFMVCLTVALYLLNWLNAVTLIGITLLNSTLESLRCPAGVAIIPKILDREKFTAGTALNQTLCRVTELIGMAAAGGIIAFLGNSAALLIDAGTFLFSGIIIGWIRLEEAPFQKSGGSIHQTLSQFGKELAEIVYTSRSVMDLTEIASVILGTAEFSLNGEPLGEVQMKEQLYPFSIEVGEGGAEYAGPYAASMEELCKKLGAEYQWDEINKRATGVYQGISLSLTAGESLALVNGERKEIETRVRGKDGVFTQVPMPAVEYHGGISAAILFFGEVWGLEFQVLDGEIIVVP